MDASQYCHVIVLKISAFSQTSEQSFKKTGKLEEFSSFSISLKLGELPYATRHASGTNF